VKPHQDSSRHLAAFYAVSGIAMPDLDCYSDNIDGLRCLLLDCGVVNFTAEEVTRGGTIIPPRERWSTGPLLFWWAQELRDEVGEPVHLRWWYRDEELNKRVGGASGSDHLSASAVDLDFRSRRSLEAARMVLEPVYESGLFNISLGVGDRTIHLGFYSANGHRRWWYGSYGLRLR